MSALRIRTTDGANHVRDLGPDIAFGHRRVPGGSIHPTTPPGTGRREATR